MGFFETGVINLLAAFHPVDPTQAAISIDNFRPQAKIQMNGRKYLELVDYSQQRSQDLKWLHKNLINYYL